MIVFEEKLFVIFVADGDSVFNEMMLLHILVTLKEHVLLTCDLSTATGKYLRKNTHVSEKMV